MTDLQEHLLIGPDLSSEEDRERWEAHDDGEADWVLRKLAAAKAEADRIKRNAAAERNRVDVWEDDALRQVQHDIDYFEGQAIRYRRSLEATNPDLPKTYKLPHGSIARRKGSESVQVTDEDSFVDWAQTHAPEALNRTVAKAVVKGWGHMDDGTVISDCGEKVPGVSVVRGEDRYEVRPAAPSAVEDLEPF